VHLSDTHFGWLVRDDKEIDMHRFFDSENSDRLSTQMIAELQVYNRQRDVPASEVTLVVSGDLTYRGNVAEYALVARFLEEVCEGVGLSRDRVFLVPGNHDVNWHASTAEIAHRFDDYLSFLFEFYGETEFRKRYPLISWDFRIQSPRPKANEIIAVWRDADALFVGLNSCVYETHQDHYGFVGRRQLDNLAQLVEREGDETPTKIAVMHHHLHPFPEPLDSRDKSQVFLDLSTTRDAGLVERRLERLGFDLVLHGHKHKPQVRETYVRDRSETQLREHPRRLIVSGCGSTGVNSREREHSEANHYALLELRHNPRQEGTEFVRIEWRELTEGVGAEWTTTQIWGIPG
jgi:3',5'-cyclic AMP phosphodiesterase CpdA